MLSTRTLFTLAMTIALVPSAAAGAVDEPPAAAARQAVDDALEGQDLDHPPPGSPGDRALWRSGHEVTVALHVERARSTRLQAVLRSLGYVERARALAAQRGDAGAKGRALEESLGDAHGVLVSLLTARWPVDTYRVCAYPAMELGSILSYGKSDPSTVARHRAMLVGCVEQAQAAVSAMKNGNDLLEQAMRAVDAASRARDESDAVVAAPATGTATPAAPLRTAAAERVDGRDDRGRDRDRDRHHDHDHDHERTSRGEER